MRYQKKEEGSKNVNPTELERFLDKIKFLYKIYRKLRVLFGEMLARYIFLQFSVKKSCRQVMSQPIISNYHL